MERLGGSIKIAEELGRDVPAQRALEIMAAEAHLRSGKIAFGISVYDDSLTPVDASALTSDWAKEIKTNLKAQGRSVRFIESDEGVLNSATVFHNHLHTKGCEFIVRAHAGRYSVAVTRAVQPLSDLSRRDFGRPGRDDVSGMLPPKLALMMINLGILNFRPASPVVGFENFDFTILDPFCGSGTILTEAARLGITKLSGTDVSKKAIDDTKRNLDWTIAQNLKLKILNLKLFISDVAHLPSHIQPNDVDAIITEPYMGPPLRGAESPDQIKKTTNELADLYLQAFTSFTQILKPTASVVFVIPRFTVSGHTYTISDKIIGKLKDLGFAKERLVPESISPTTYILYQRPRQFVGREIWKFTYQKTDS